MGEDTAWPRSSGWPRSGRRRRPPPGRIEPLDLLDDFAEHVRGFVDLCAGPLCGWWPTPPTAWAAWWSQVFDTLPFDLEMMYGELDGTFPNHPADPIQPENLATCRPGARGRRRRGAGLRRRRRPGVPRRRSGGTPLWARPPPPSWPRACSSEPGSTILYNLICSQAVPEVIREHGGTPVRTRVGHSFIKAVMAETGGVRRRALGPLLLPRQLPGRLGLRIAALMVLEQISKAGAPLSTLRKPFDRYAASGEINMVVADAAGSSTGWPPYPGTAQDRRRSDRRPR